MSTENPITLRLPKSALARARKLVPMLANSPELAAFRLSRSAVLRLAVLRGLASLESDSAAAAKTGEAA